jgi:hypothetical protein
VLLDLPDQKAIPVTLELQAHKARPALKGLQVSKESKDQREMSVLRVSKAYKVQPEMLAKPDLPESKGQPAT